eukprot:10604475-Prorocentrum_lima.AAC.1
METPETTGWEGVAVAWRRLGDGDGYNDGEQAVDITQEAFCQGQKIFRSDKGTVVELSLIHI